MRRRLGRDRAAAAVTGRTGTGGAPTSMRRPSGTGAIVCAMSKRSTGSLRDTLVVKPGSRVDLAKHDTDATFGHSKEDAAEATAANLARLEAVQERLWAEHRHRVLIVLQGMDASGKDGTIKHVMTAFHPLGCRVTGFGVPSETELAHDYLWRVHQVVPGDGEIAIFNRSHYEDVLVVRVHSLVPKARWSRRYDQINEFEATLASEGTTILKFFLHLGPDEQLQRFRERYDDPTKRWKFKLGDLEERKRWTDYQKAYEVVLERCSTEAAPWFIVPADRKWFRDLAISGIVAEALAGRKPRYPARDDLPADLVIE
jgi:PPK2 family polyphosphate:nucleotide phosphotransferase